MPYYYLEDMTTEDIDKIISARQPKEKAKPEKITAEVSYVVWNGTRKHPKAKEYTEILSFLSTDKMIDTTYGGRKRMSSVKIIKVI